MASLGSVRYKVYTKTGDKGTTSLYSGERRQKDDVFFQALGDVDELNACIGLSREHCAAHGVGIEAQLAEIQSRLLDAGSAIATPARSSRPEQLARAAFPSHITGSLEAWIDAMEEALPPLKNFILPVRGSASVGSLFPPNPRSQVSLFFLPLFPPACLTVRRPCFRTPTCCAHSVPAR